MNLNTAGLTARPQTKVTREDWIETALNTLINEGIKQIKVLVLAKKLGVSRASFYWYFDDKEQLLDELINQWSATNTEAILQQAARPADSIIEGVINIFSCWLDEKSFNPRLDAAVRAWAHQDKHINQQVDQQDEKRLNAIKNMFLKHGYCESEAFIRARVLYFTQIGYYALEIQESINRRLSYFEPYLYCFTGIRPSKKQITKAVKLIKNK